MRQAALFILFKIITTQIFSQCLVPGGLPDTVLPVVNSTVIPVPNIAGDNLYHDKGYVFQVARRDNSLFLYGNFTNLASNHGRGIVLDGADKTVISSRQWNIDGDVKASLPDGEGGFYIAGNFHHIGDIERRFIARINAFGVPLPWQPAVDTTVNVLYKRNDTLYIGGSFKKINNKDRRSFAMYSLQGDSLFSQQFNMVDIETQSGFGEVVALKPYNDTLLIAGESKTLIRKLNMKTGKLLNWEVPQDGIYDDNYIESLDISAGLGRIFYVAGKKMQALDLYSGKRLFEFFSATTGLPYDAGMGRLGCVKVVGDRLLVAGQMTHAIAQPSVGKVPRMGLCALDPITGNLLDTDFGLNNFATYIDVIGDRLYVSGFFTTINGQFRDHFAELDAATLTLTNWQLAPSDPLATLSVSGNRYFAGGLMNGVYSTHRNGFAEIDVNTGEILPFNPSFDNSNAESPAKMFLYGDSLYILAKRKVEYGFHNDIILSNIKTGETSNTGVNYTDWAFDSSYIYVCEPGEILRYHLRPFKVDVWGYKNTPISYPSNIMVSDNNIYCSGQYGDYTSQVVQFNKDEGRLLNRWSYTPGTSIFSQITMGNDTTIYVSGYITSLRNIKEHNFGAISANTGIPMNWSPSFSASQAFSKFQVFRYNQGKLWFTDLPAKEDAKQVFGLGALDAATANLLPSTVNLYSDRNGWSTGYEINGLAGDINFDKDYFYVAGSFEFVNGRFNPGLARLRYQSTLPPVTSGTSILGPDTLVVGTDSTRYTVSPADRDKYSYNWTYSGSGVEINVNGLDTLWIKTDSGATAGVLKVQAQNYCGLAAPLEKNILVGNIDLAVSTLKINAGSFATGQAVTFTFSEANTGTLPAGAHTVYFYFSHDSKLLSRYGNGQLVYRYTRNETLPAGNVTDPVNGTFNIPCVTNYGTYYLFAVIDSAQVVPESDKNNNITAIPIIINAGELIPSYFSVNASPSANVCSGQLVTLIADTSKCLNCTYRWNDGTMGGIKVVDTSGYYYIVAKNGCGTNSASREVVIQSVPYLSVGSEPDHICLGSSVTLYASGASTYTWSGPGLNPTNSYSVKVTPTTIGKNTYTVTAESNGCSTTMTYDLMVYDPNQDTTFTISYTGCNTGNLEFTANSAGDHDYFDYEWFVNGISDSHGRTLYIPNYLNAPEVFCQLTYTTLCNTPVKQTSPVIKVNCLPASGGVTIDGVKSFLISPNPTNGLININMTLSRSLTVSVRVMDIYGNIVYTETPKIYSGTVSLKIDLRGKQPGLYFLTTIIDGHPFTIKVLLI